MSAGNQRASDAIALGQAPTQSYASSETAPVVKMDSAESAGDEKRADVEAGSKAGELSYEGKTQMDAEQALRESRYLSGSESYSQYHRSSIRAWPTGEGLVRGSASGAARKA